MFGGLQLPVPKRCERTTTGATVGLVGAVIVASAVTACAGSSTQPPQDVVHSSPVVVPCGASSTVADMVRSVLRIAVARPPVPVTVGSAITFQASTTHPIFLRPSTGGCLLSSALVANPGGGNPLQVRNSTFVFTRPGTVDVVSVVASGPPKSENAYEDQPVRVAAAASPSR